MTADRHVGRAELLHHERPAEVAEPGAADRLGQRRRRQPELAHPREDRAVEALGLVALDRASGATSRCANSRAVVSEQPLLVGQAAVRSTRRSRSRG